MKDYSEAVRLYEMGWSVGKVADHFGVSRQSMWKSLGRRTTLRSREDAAALTRKPETAIRRKRAKTKDRYRQRAARITVGQMKAIRERDKVCRMCGAEGTDFDHITPVAIGGQTEMDNLQLLCHPCHVEKSRGDRTLAAKHRREVRQQEASSISSSEASRSCASQPQPQAAAREPRTTAGSGPSSPVWLASWDPDTSSWRTSQVSLLSTEDERFPRSSERWPTSGMTRRGQAFALPMSARPTGGSGSSSSLNVPTPTASDAIWGDKEYERRGKDGRNHNLGLVEWAKMLPTPVADHSRGLAQPQTDYQSLPNAVLSLGEPTPPRSTDGSE